MKSRLIIPAGEARSELIVERSRFITAVAPAFSVDEAREFILKIKGEFQDASHHVPCFKIGHGAGLITHCSDDGEPSGTAGRPSLAVLEGSEFGDVVAVTTRYFGGIKLGTGGLVRAYSESMRSALRNTPRAEKVSTTTLMLAFDYSLFERVRNLAAEMNAFILDEEFGADVTLTIRLRDEQVTEFSSHITELSRGRVNVIIVDKMNVAILPLLE